MTTDIDLKKEQQATLARPPRPYGVLARMLFWGMDLYYGKELTLSKMRILEILARIPYQAWETRQYHRLDRSFSDSEAVEKAADIIRWGREAQDNEFWHLQVVEEKIRHDRVKINWFNGRLVPSIAAFKYNLFSRALALLSIRTAFRLNADFEDHAEHEYMRYVKEHPDLDNQPVEGRVFANHKGLKTWGDVFRRLALDERDHMNNSLIHCGLGSEVAAYQSPQK